MFRIFGGDGGSSLCTIPLIHITGTSTKARNQLLDGFATRKTAFPNIGEVSTLSIRPKILKEIESTAHIRVPSPFGGP